MKNKDADTKLQKILFLLSAKALSGGVLVVRQNAKLLADKGYDVTVTYLFEKESNDESDSAFSSIAPAREIMHEKLPADEIFDVVVATWWETAYHASEVKAKSYVYFIQGFEERLYPKNSHWPLLVQRTYQSGFRYIVVNSGLQRYLRDTFGQASTIIPPGIDFEEYDCQPLIPRTPGKLRVMVEGSPQAEFKRVDLALEALSDLSGVEVVYVSPAGKPTKERHIDYFFEHVAHSQMPAIYKSCDLILKLSTDETVSMPVLEAFASGACAIVSEFFGGSDLVRHQENGLVVPVDDLAAARAALVRLRDDSELLKTLQKAAGETAAKHDLKEMNDRFEEELLHCFQNPASPRPPLSDCLPSFQAAHRERLELMRLEQDCQQWKKGFEQKSDALTAAASTLQSLQNSRSYRVGNGLAKVYRRIKRAKKQ